MRRNPLNKAAWRDFAANPGRSVALFLIIALTIMATQSFFLVADSVRDVVERAQEEDRLEDAQITLAAELTKEQEKAIPDGMLWEENRYSDLSWKKDTTLRVFEERRRLNVAEIFDGKAPAKGEIAIDRTFMERNGLKIGDTVELAGERLRISGSVALIDYTTLIKSSSDILMDPQHFGVAIVPSKGLEALAPSPNIALFLRFEDRGLDLVERTDRVQKLAKELIARGVSPLSVEMKESRPQISYFTDDMSGDVPMMLLMFLILLCIEAFLFVILAKNRIVEEAPTIGTLLACGMKPREYLLHSLYSPFILTLAAVLVGNVCGFFFMVPGYAKLYYTTYSLPPFVMTKSLEPFAIASLTPIVLILLVNAVILGMKLRISPMRFLRRDLGRRRHGKDSRLPVRWPFFRRYRLRVFLSNKGSYLVLFVGLFLAMLLASFGLGMPSFLSHYSDSAEENAVAPYEYVLKAPMEPEALRAALKADNPKDAAEGARLAVIDALQGRQRLFDKEITVFVYAFAGDTKSDESLPEDGVLVSRGLARRMELSKGETLALTDRFTGDEVRFRVGGVGEKNDGFFVMTRLNSYARLRDVDGKRVNAVLSRTPLKIPKELLYSSRTADDARLVAKQFMELISNVEGVIMGTSAIVFAIVLYVLSKVQIEQNRLPISYLKIIGYEEREISRIYVRVTTIAVLAFLVLSVPLVHVSMGAMYDLVMAKMGVYVEPYVDPAVYPPLIAAGFLLYLAVRFFILRRIGKIDPAAALKEQ